MNSMSVAATRLAASKAEAEQGASVLGFCDGREWARYDADYESLRRLAAAAHEGRLEDANPEDIAEAVGDTNLPDEAADFWDAICGDRYPCKAYALAFVSGALTVANEIKAESV